MNLRSYLLEFERVGRYLRVTAIDPESGEEASLQAAAQAPRGPIGQLAIRKLRRQQGLPETAVGENAHAAHDHEPPHPASGDSDPEGGSWA